MIDTIRSYLDQRGLPYTPTKQIEGMYGIVLILEATKSNVSPKKWSAKTLNPGRLFKNQRNIQALFNEKCGFGWDFHLTTMYCLRLALIS